MKTVKLASTGLPRHAADRGEQARARRSATSELEEKVMELARKSGIGAQFGGKYFALDARVIRLPRHGASLPGRDRRLLLGRSQHQGPDRPRRALARGARAQPRPVHSRPQYRDGLDAEHGVPIDLNRPMKEILAELTKYPVSTPLKLTGTIVVAPRHRPRQDQGTARPRRGNARVPEGPSGLLRRPGQDPRGHALRLVRPDHGRPHGQLRRPLPVARRLDGHDRQGEPLDRP